MASSVKVKHHLRGYYELRRAPGVVKDLEARGARMKRKCGEGYEMSSQQGARRPQGRWRVAVFTQTNRAKRDNAKHATLLRSIDSARG